MTIHSQFLQLDAGVGLHRLQHIHHLERDPLERGARGDMAFTVPLFDEFMRRAMPTIDA